MMLTMIKFLQWSLEQQSLTLLIRNEQLHYTHLSSKSHKYPQFVSLLNMQLEFLVVYLHMNVVLGPLLQEEEKIFEIEMQKNQLNSMA